jgi:uncharacterized protein YcbK (DUF882 family)
MVAAGFRTVEDAQAMLGISTDGIVGPITRYEWKEFVEGGYKVTPHFHLDEFRCKCGCGRVRVARRLPLRLEVLRRLRKSNGKLYFPKGVRIVSGYRCPTHNEKVGGASGSQHLLGKAADIANVVDYHVMRRAGLFAGIGVSANGNVVHVDVRGGANAAAPVVWWYK